MRHLGWDAGACVLLATTWGCQATLGDAVDGPSAPELEEQPLDLSIDRVDISHGALRLSATMRDGSADVAFALGRSCAPREVGGGWATPSSLVWRFTEEEVAAALGCDLLVTARASSASGIVRKVASLAVSAELVLSSPGEASEVPNLSHSKSDMTADFGAAIDGRRLSIGDSLVGPLPSDSVDTPATRFVFPLRAFARAVLSGSQVRLGGSRFAPSVSVAGVTLDEQPPEPQIDPASAQESAAESDERTDPARAM